MRWFGTQEPGTDATPTENVLSTPQIPNRRGEVPSLDMNPNLYGLAIIYK